LCAPYLFGRDRISQATQTWSEAEAAALELKRQQDRYQKLKEQYDNKDSMKCLIF
jgi:hypothetical protein